MARQQIVVAIALTACCALPGWAQTAGPSVIVAPPPIWSDLSVPQKIILAPLSDEWDSMEAIRQKKWMEIATRFAAMNPEEQRRLQGQMQEWGRLTPGERQTAREIYKYTSQLSADKKQELKQKWEEYSNLPEEEKEKLKKEASNRPIKSIKPFVPDVAVHSLPESSALPFPRDVRGGPGPLPATSSPTANP